MNIVTFTLLSAAAKPKYDARGLKSELSYFEGIALGIEGIEHYHTCFVGSISKILIVSFHCHAQPDS